MADGPLYPAGSGLEGFGYLGVEDLGNGVDHIHVVDGDHDGLPQVLVALDVGGDTDLMDDVRDHAFDAVLVGPAGRGGPEALPSPDHLLHALHHGRHIAGLQHHILNPQIGCGGGHVVCDKPRCSQRGRFAIHAGNGLEHTDAVLFAQHQVQYQNIGFSLSNQADGLFPIIGGAHHLEALRALQGGCKPRAEFL